MLIAHRSDKPRLPALAARLRLGAVHGTGAVGAGTALAGKCNCEARFGRACESGANSNIRQVPGQPRSASRQRRQGTTRNPLPKNELWVAGNASGFPTALGASGGKKLV